MNFSIEKYHLKSNSFFQRLSVKVAAELRRNCIRKEFLKQEYLFKEKCFSKGIYILTKGKVKIFQTNSDGKQNIVYIYKKGDYFGYRPLLANEPHPVSAMAMDNVVVLFIPREIFLPLLNNSTELASELLINLSKEFSVWINKMTVFAQYGVRERVALGLLILREVYQKTNEKPSQVSISINRDDFAGFVGMAKETLVRMLRYFKDEKIISTKGTKIYIQKPKTLLNIISII